jgi:hypothetical protein
MDFSESEAYNDPNWLIQEFRNFVVVAVIGTYYLRWLERFGEEHIVKQSIADGHTSMHDEEDFENFLELLLDEILIAISPRLKIIQYLKYKSLILQVIFLKRDTFQFNLEAILESIYEICKQVIHIYLMNYFGTQLRVEVFVLR